MAAFGPGDVARLLEDAGIVRHRGKIEAAIGNARAALAVIEESGSLAAYFWPRAGARGPAPTAPADIPAQTEASRALSRDLRQRGSSFVGPTIVYAFMQAVGLVDDHADGCVVRRAVERERGPLLRRYGAAGG